MSDSQQESAFARPELPYTADEVTTLRAFLDHYRVTVKRQVEGLSHEQLNATLPPATMTLAGIVKHLGLVEDWWLPMVLEGRETELPWVDEAALQADNDWDWSSAAHDDLDTILTHFDQAVLESDRAMDRAMAGDGLDTLAKRPRRTGEVVTLRWILVHLVEEYARHAGHADLIRESIDGATDL